MKACGSRILLLFIIFIFIKSSKAQSKIDTLSSLIETSHEDTSKVKLLIRLAIEMANNNSYELAIIKSNEAIELAKKLKYNKQIINANNATGIVYYLQGDYDKALYYHHEALRLATDNKLGYETAITNVHISDVYFFSQKYDSAIKSCKSAIIFFEDNNKFLELSNPLVNLAASYYAVGDYESSLKNYMRALRINEQLNKDINLPSIYLGIGNVYLSQSNHDKAIQYYNLSYEISIKTNQESYASLALNNIGNIYHGSRNYSKAIEYFLKSLELKEKNHAEKDEMVNTLMNIGSAYSLNNDEVKAMDYYNKSLALSKELSNYTGMANSYINIGVLSGKQKKYKDAISFINKGLSYAKRVGLKDQIKSAYEQLADMYSKIHDYEKAYEYHLLFSDLKDTLLNEDNNRSINELQTKYETENKEKQIQLLSTEKQLQGVEIKSQRIYALSAIIGFILISVFAIFVFRSYRQSQKAKNIISNQNKSITDSINYARKIQNAILPDVNHIQEIIPDSFVLYKPKDIVSGDFYWFNEYLDHWLIAVADCTGHGVPGGFMSMVGSNTLSQITNISLNHRPSYVLQNLNDEIRNTLHQNKENAESKDGMDIALIKYDKNNSKLEYAGANRALWIIRSKDNILEEIKPDKKSIGGLQESERTKFTNHVVDINNDDAIYLSSDGYADQFGGEDGRKLMTKRFKELLLKIYREPIEIQKTFLNEYIDRWRGTNEQVDDILVIGIKFHNSEYITRPTTVMRRELVDLLFPSKRKSEDNASAHSFFMPLISGGLLLVFTPFIILESLLRARNPIDDLSLPLGMMSFAVKV